MAAEPRPHSHDVHVPDEPETILIAPEELDLPQRGASYERWSLAVHVETKEQRALSLWASFDRRAQGPRGASGHSLSWALCDVTAERHRSGLDIDAVRRAALREAIERGAGGLDRGLSRAALEMMDTGALPAPERAMFSEPRIAEHGLDLRYGGHRLSRGEAGGHRVVLGEMRGARGAHLRLRALKPPIVLSDGEGGGLGDEAGSVVCVWPSTFVDGTVFLDGEDHLVSGFGHYEREIGPASRPASPAEPHVTRKAAVHLDDGSSITLAVLSRPESGEIVRARALVTDVRGRAAPLDRATLEPLAWFRSTRSYYEYPTRFSLRIPGAGLDLVLDAVFPDQEITTLVSGPPSWRGRARVTGSRWGRPIAGVAWIELTAPPQYHDLGGFFSAVRRSVKREIDEVVSRTPSPRQLAELVGAVDHAERLAGVSGPHLGHALVAPLLEIIERGGKAWRSFATLAAIDAVGGDSRRFSPWLAMPEFIHSGSLIVDDVQDGSTIRRGGKTCHETHGMPTAINAGTAAYFIAEQVITRCPLAPERAQRISRLYFEAMRAGHGGQALDIAGLDDLLPEAIESGDMSALELRVTAINRLKTAVPAGATARMGAIAGHGTDAQVEGLGDYIESVGLAFQIIDDVLNLRGFQGDLKQRGEDIRIGKVTLPIVRALGRMGREDRAALWQTVKSKSQDDDVIAQAITSIEATGALDACVAEAHALVEGAWRRLDPLIPPSTAKARLRAFGWYVLERSF